MDESFKMERGDQLVRQRSRGRQDTNLSSSMRLRLISRAIEHCYVFYANFFGVSKSEHDFQGLATEYCRVFSNAEPLRLFGEGSVQEKDHLNLWCLAKVLSPRVYVESGVYIGSSLHALINATKPEKVIAIDPDLGNLRLPMTDVSNVELIDSKDFSQLDLDLTADSSSLIFFDDHINTADRIIQAASKGARYVLFDDSTGLEGVCQRLFPAVPTIPMILNADILRPGDELSWTYSESNSRPIKRFVRALLHGGGGSRLTLKIDVALVEKCIQARALIMKCEAIPDLGRYLPQLRPSPTIDTTKFLLELVRRSSD